MTIEHLRIDIAIKNLKDLDKNCHNEEVDRSHDNDQSEYNDTKRTASRLLNVDNDVCLMTSLLKESSSDSITASRLLSVDSDVCLVTHQQQQRQ